MALTCSTRGPDQMMAYSLLMQHWPNNLGYAHLLVNGKNANELLAQDVRLLVLGCS
jgi:hypothetical protein